MVSFLAWIVEQESNSPVALVFKDFTCGTRACKLSAVKAIQTKSLPLVQWHVRRYPKKYENNQHAAEAIAFHFDADVWNFLKTYKGCGIIPINGATANAAGRAKNIEMLTDLYENYHITAANKDLQGLKGLVDDETLRSWGFVDLGGRVNRYGNIYFPILIEFTLPSIDVLPAAHVDKKKKRKQEKLRWAKHWTKTQSKGRNNKHRHR